MGKPIVSKKSGTITANGQTIVIDTTEANSAVVMLSGTYAATIAFEVSDDDATVWFPIQVCSASTSATVTTHNTANAKIAYEVSVSSYSRFRVRATAYTSGTMGVVLVASTSESEPNPNVTGTVSVSGTVTATATPATLTPSMFVTAASTNGATAKTSAGTLFNVVASNVTATAAYIKFYNKTTAPTVGTDVPVLTIPVPANSNVSFEYGMGIRFSSGIGRAVTAAIGATDTGVAVAGIQVAFNYI